MLLEVVEIFNSVYITGTAEMLRCAAGVEVCFRYYHFM
jgi:hypothetical protein